MKYTQEQFDKLPKWAQSEIKRLERDNESLNLRISQENGEAETDTFICKLMDKIPMQKGSMIRFKVNDNGCWADIRVSDCGRGIIVHTNSNIGGDMVIKPRSSNAFNIEFLQS